MFLIGPLGLHTWIVTMHILRRHGGGVLCRDGNKVLLKRCIPNEEIRKKMMTRNVFINCSRQFNAIYKNGQLKALKNIRPGDVISLKRPPKVKLSKDDEIELDRLAKMSLEHAKKN